MKNYPLLGALALLALAGCSAASIASDGSAGVGAAAMAAQGGRDQQRQRPRLDPVGDPGKVAAADIRFARAARDDGQWTAFARYAASGAVIHGADGPFQAGPWLASQSNPAQSVSWSPNAVWSSCDGSLAVSFGRFQQADGLLGSYVTVWELQRGGDYKWVYDMGAPDNPQPAPRAPAVEPGIDVIIVPGLNTIEGKVADCPRRGDAPPPAAPPFAAEDTAQTAHAASRDATLDWRWTHASDGTRRVQVRYLREGQWEQVVDFTAPPAGES